MSVYKCIKFGLEEEHIRWNMKTSITLNLDGMSLASFCQSRAELYVNRKGKHSFDVQVVVDLQLHCHEHGRMLAGFYGTHDAFIWQNSLVTEGCCNQLWN